MSASRHVDLRHGHAIEEIAAQPRRDAHHLHRLVVVARRRAVAGSEADRLAQRILVGEQAPRQRLVDDGHARGGRRVLLLRRELTPAQHAETQRPEVVGADDHVGGIAAAGGRWRDTGTFDGTPFAETRRTARWTSAKPTRYRESPARAPSRGDTPHAPAARRIRPDLDRRSRAGGARTGIPDPRRPPASRRARTARPPRATSATAQSDRRPARSSRRTSACRPSRETCPRPAPSDLSPRPSVTASALARGRTRACWPPRRRLSRRGRSHQASDRIRAPAAAAG